MKKRFKHAAAVITTLASEILVNGMDHLLSVIFVMYATNVASCGRCKHQWDSGCVEGMVAEDPFADDDDDWLYDVSIGVDCLSTEKQQITCPNCGLTVGNYIGICDKQSLQVKLRSDLFLVKNETEHKLKFVTSYAETKAGRGKKRKDGSYGPTRVYTKIKKNIFSIHVDRGLVYTFNALIKGAMPAQLSLHSSLYYLSDIASLAKVACEYLYNFHTERTGYAPPALSYYSTTDLMRLVKAPYIPADIFEAIGYVHSCSDNATRRKILAGALTANPLNKIMDVFGLMGWERKFALADMCRLHALKALRGVFNSVDITKAVIALLLNNSYIQNWPSYIPLLKALCNVKGEKGIVRSIDGHVECWTDTVAMYNDFMVAVNEGRWTININLTGNIRDIHDRLSRDYDKLGKRNYVFDYDHARYDLARNPIQIDDIVFELAIDSNQLIEVGNAMHICVGSYGENVYAKKTNVIVGWNNNKPVVCLQVSANMKKLLQAKLNCNEVVKNSPAMKDLVDKYIATIGVVYNKGLADM